MAAENWMRLRAYARHRKVALSAVQKAIESGRVTAVKRDGARLVGIEQVAADEQWLKNTDPDQAARTQGMLPPPERGAPAAGPSAAAPSAPGEPNREEPAAALTLEPPGGDEKSAPADPSKDFGYLESRAKRERFQAQQAELDYLEAIGELVPKAELMEAAIRRYRAIRDKLLNIPDRLSAIAAAETDPARVHALLTKEITQVLHELSDDARAEIARGVAESVAA